MGDIPSNIGKVLEPLVQPFIALLDLLDYLNPFSENFILSGLFSFLGNILEPLNPFSEKFILKGVLDFFVTLLDYLNPFSENFFLKVLFEWIGNFFNMLWDLFVSLFVPEEDYFDRQIETIKQELYRILPYNDYINLFGTIKDISTSEEIAIDLNGYKIREYEY